MHGWCTTCVVFAYTSTSAGMATGLNNNNNSNNRRRQIYSRGAGGNPGQCGAGQVINVIKRGSGNPQGAVDHTYCQYARLITYIHTIDKFTYIYQSQSSPPVLISLGLSLSISVTFMFIIYMCIISSNMFMPCINMLYVCLCVFICIYLYLYDLLLMCGVYVKSFSNSVCILLYWGIENYSCVFLLNW